MDVIQYTMERLPIWSVIPSCVMWLVWRERNSHVFEDIERSVPQLKSQLVGTLFGTTVSPTFCLIPCILVDLSFLFSSIVKVLP